MLKLLHINIERDKHHARYAPLVGSFRPDVAMMQEVLEDDIPTVQGILGMKHIAYAPLCLHPADGNPRVTGNLLASHAPLNNLREIVYAGNGSGRDYVDPLKQATDPATPIRYPLLTAEINHQGQTYRVATTHFPWTPNGEANDIQRNAITNLLKELSAFPSLILTGDFNAPRGKEIFAKLAEAYRDNIPPHYICSLDKSLHRAGNALPDYMVDGLFTTPDYVAEDVKLHSGVSDHMAVTATIRKA